MKSWNIPKICVFYYTLIHFGVFSLCRNEPQKCFVFKAYRQQTLPNLPYELSLPSLLYHWSISNRV